ncbi:hypothetical protein L9F63_016541, partial [Diploptera punctata]
ARTQLSREIASKREDSKVVLLFQEKETHTGTENFIKSTGFNPIGHKLAAFNNLTHRLACRSLTIHTLRSTHLHRLEFNWTLVKKWGENIWGRHTGIQVMETFSY